MLGTLFEEMFLIFVGENDFWAKPLRMTSEDAYQILKQITGHDFGDDAIAWYEYGRREGLCLLLDEVWFTEFKERWGK